MRSAKIGLTEVMGAIEVITYEVGAVSILLEKKLAVL